MVLIDEIQSLIMGKTEGDYWDFKERWHDNNASLLHDIICMANNQFGRDAYIIIGVSDSKSPDGVKIKGVSGENRRDQQHLIDFLRKKKFAGGFRPSVYVQTLNIPDNEGNAREIDVIIIRNSAKTPFFLTDNYRDKDKEIRAGFIYTRIGDTNTPIDSIADLDKIEYLWRKRFGLDLTAMDRLLRLLDEPDEWEKNSDNIFPKYHRRYPEFQIQINDIDDQSFFANNSIIKNIADCFWDKEFYVYKVFVTYHSTILFEDDVVYLDGAKILIPFPQSYTVYLDEKNDIESSLTYVYLDKESIPGKLFNCFAQTEKHWSLYKWSLKQGEAILLFEDDSDKSQFDIFVLERQETVQKEYEEALEEKGFIKTEDTNEYFCFGWSKRNAIISWHMYEQYRGIKGSRLIDKLPNPPKAGGSNK